MKITELENYNYNKEYESFCFQNCVKQVLSYYGVENVDLYINMSLYFKLIENNNEICIKSNTSVVLPEFEDIEMKIVYENNDDYYKIWLENLSIIKQKQPIIVGVDFYYLNYFPLYKKKHGLHHVVVDDFNEVTNMVSILDWIDPWFFKGEISLEEFLLARDSSNEFDGSVYSGCPILNRWSKINNNLVCKHVIYLILRQLELTYDQYYVDIKSKDEFNGVHATKQLKKFFYRINEYSDDKAIKLQPLHKQLYFVNRRRDLFKLCLNEAYSLLGITILNDLANETSKLYSAWEKLNLMIGKASLRIKENSITKLISIVDDIIILEEQYRYLLEDTIKQVGKVNLPDSCLTPNLFE
ncbi:hypothetical protein [Anaerocolumna jejuensis]|uniref:hypothetical protein n=1 Tax=Anaerocolumna jejuensis TaxID=259063 RepID=UPI003F7B85A5